MYATLNFFSSLTPFGQCEKGSSPALLISTMEQPFSSSNALVLTLSRLAESCIFKLLGYITSFKTINYRSLLDDFPV